MRKALAALLLLSAAVIAAFIWQSNRGTWINTYSRCPDSPNYGTLAATGAPAFSVEGAQPQVGSIPHGTRVEVVSEEDGVTRIRTEGREVLVASAFVSDYDPAGGVRPDASYCSAADG